MRQEQSDAASYIAWSLRKFYRHLRKFESAISASATAAAAAAAVIHPTLPHPPPPQLSYSLSTPHHPTLPAFSTPTTLSNMVATQMFLGAAATLVASSTAFVTPPVAVRSAAPASSSSLTMQSEGSAYVATLPGAPFSDGKVSIVLVVYRIV